MKFLRDKLKLRIYQQTILANCYNKNSLVVLPTGLGKTFIAIGLAGLSIDQGLVVVMAPTKPLCVQHQKTFSEFFDEEDKLVVMTGAVKPSDRKDLWKTAKIVFCTPQTFERDLLKRYISIDSISFLVLDEAHRATGDYAYVWIAKQFADKPNKYMLALSASPASNREDLDEICKNLRVQNIEVKTERDTDVAPYIKKKEIIKLEVELPPEIKDIKSSLEVCLKSRLKELKDMNIIYSASISKVRKTDLIKLQKKLAGELSSRNIEKYAQISIVASCLKLYHVIEMCQTQGIEQVVDFFKKLEKQAKTIKASKQLLMDWNFKKAVIKAYDASGAGIEHPKVNALRELIKENFSDNMKIIIFANYRSSVERLVKTLEKIDGVRPREFIGQKSGMSQKMQVAVLERFKEGKYNVLVATSISEEGLHIENADLGIFFEPVPSALRSIQRRGRIGRINVGKVYMLITKDTLDEKYYWAAWNKERRMGEILEDLRDELKDGKQTRLFKS